MAKFEVIEGYVKVKDKKYEKGEKLDLKREAAARLVERGVLKEIPKAKKEAK